MRSAEEWAPDIMAEDHFAAVVRIVQQIQREAIEATAKVVEQYGSAWDCTAQQFAREIRALIGAKGK